MRVARTGNEAMAEAMRQINPDVVAAYPITPATEVVQLLSNFVADGLVKTEFVAVESEHSAMSACIGAQAAGVRAMTGTASQGLILMSEMLYIASGLRLPIVMAEVNRAISSPINIHCDHSDTMAVRDSGWIQIYSENAQEAYDNLIQAVRIAEKAMLPVMVTIDGFIISHGMEAIDVLEDEEVTEFIKEYKPAHPLLDVNNPVTVGAIDFTDYFFEHKRQTIEAMQRSKDVIQKVSQEFSKRFGRRYSLFEEYKLDDAEIAIVLIGSAAGTAKVVIDKLRDHGIKVGLLKIRVFRPFPGLELREALKDIMAIAVMDRADGLNTVGGPLYEEIKAILYEVEQRPKIVNYIYGLGGRDTTLRHIEGVFNDLSEVVRTGQIKEPVSYLGVRE